MLELNKIADDFVLDFDEFYEFYEDFYEFGGRLEIGFSKNLD